MCDASAAEYYAPKYTKYFSGGRIFGISLMTKNGHSELTNINPDPNRPHGDEKSRSISRSWIDEKIIV